MRIMKTELRVLFFSPIAWMVLIVFAFQAGLAYCGGFSDELRSLAMGYKPFNTTVNLIGGYDGVYAEMLNNLYLYIPLLTMGLMSRELSSGSIKLLYSSPVSSLQIVLGKYLSVVVYGLILVVMLLIPMIFTMFSVKSVVGCFSYCLCLCCNWIVYVNDHEISGCRCDWDFGCFSRLEFYWKSGARYRFRS